MNSYEPRVYTIPLRYFQRPSVPSLTIFVNGVLMQAGYGTNEMQMPSYNLKLTNHQGFIYFALIALFNDHSTSDGIKIHLND